MTSEETENFDKKIDIPGLKEAVKKINELVEHYPELQNIDKLLTEHPEFEEMEIKDVISILKKKNKLNAIIPQNYLIPNTKVSNKLKNIKNDGEFDVLVSNKKEVLTTISINFNNKNLDLPKNITAYDRTVLNATVSLFEAGNKEFTAAMVYRCMNGLTQNEKVSPQCIGAVTKSLDKARQLFCTIDFTNEAKAWKKDVDKFIIEDNILNTEKITISVSGNEVIGYRFNNKPILYRYAQISKQIISIPSKLLNTKSVIRSTDEVIVLREYLIRQIEIMKHTKRNNRILYETIFEELEIDTNKKYQYLLDKTKKIRDAVKKLLEHWKNESYIKDFKEYKKGKRFEGIEIFY